VALPQQKQQQRDQLLPLHSGSRRNINDLTAAGPSAFNAPGGGKDDEDEADAGPGSLVTWIVMDFCDRGPLSRLVAQMADDPVEEKLVGGWRVGAGCWGAARLGAAAASFS
jgi:hypothetical protein